MSAIDFVARDDAGNFQRGSVTTEAGARIAPGAGADVSLNLYPGQIHGYERQGDALVVVLVNGERITIGGYFAQDGTPAMDLYVSAGGELFAVDLAQAPGEGLYASYQGSGGFGKFNPEDAFFFLRGPELLVETAAIPEDDGVGMLANPLLGGLAGIPLLGLGGAGVGAAVLGQTFTREDDAPEGDGDTLSGDSSTGGSGGGNDGGGPDEGALDGGSATDGSGGGGSDGGGKDGGGTGGNDGLPPLPDRPVVEIGTGVQSSGDVTDGAEIETGVAIGGTGTPGGSVTVTVGEQTARGDVGEDGNWEVTFEPGQVPGGEYDTPVTAVIETDGGAATDRDNVVVDSETFVTIDAGAIGGDGTVNASELDAGTIVTGTAEAGARVVVAAGEARRTVTATEEGTWSTTFDSSEIAAGTYTQQVTAQATDAAGNRATARESFAVDTELGLTIETGAVAGDGVVNGAEIEGALTVTGTTGANASVTLEIAGKSYTTTATDAGTWSVELDAGALTSGTYDAAITASAVDAAGNTADAAGTIAVDTEIAITIDTGSVETDGVVNAAERADGVRLTGTTEAGAAVAVTVSGTEYAATARADGSWAVDIAAEDLPQGEVMHEVAAAATDAAGNSASATGEIAIDTATFVAFSDGPVEGDGIVNAAERADGVTLTGTTEAGASVRVSMGGTDVQAAVDEGGTWSAEFPQSALPTGQSTLRATATATDAAGNTATDRMDVEIDTETFVTADTGGIAGDGVVNFSERAEGVTLDGTAEAGAAVEVRFNGLVATTTASAEGTWAVDIPTARLPQGELSPAVTVTATDIAGNTARVTGAIRIDTVVKPLTGATDVTADDIVNAVEAAQGVTLTGTVEAGSSVTVTFEGTARAAHVTDGAWSVDFTAAEVPRGDYMAQVTVDATDAAGNTRQIADTFRVDTEAPEIPRITSTDRGVGTLRAIGVSDADEGLAVTGLEPDGGTTLFATEAVVDTRFDEIDLYFEQPIPDGSQLVISSTDDAGNQNATLFVLDQAGTDLVDTAHPGISGFDLGSIDLNFALDSDLTITAADLEAMSRNDNGLTIHGGNDDTVTISGAVATGETRQIDGKPYDIYALGDEGGRIILDQDITVLT